MSDFLVLNKVPTGQITFNIVEDPIMVIDELTPNVCLVKLKSGVEVPIYGKCDDILHLLKSQPNKKDQLLEDTTLEEKYNHFISRRERRSGNAFQPNKKDQPLRTKLRAAKSKKSILNEDILDSFNRNRNKEFI